MLRLYYRAGTGRPFRVAWELEELGVAYEPVGLSVEQCRQAEHLARQPLGRVPAVELDGEGALFESTAVVLAVADRHPDAGLIGPLGSPLREQVYAWAIFAMTELEPAAIGAHFLQGVSDDYKRGQRERFGAGAAAVGRRLDDNPFLLGEQLTAADIVVGGVLAIGDHAEVLDTAPDNVLAYFRRLQARPAYARGARRVESAF